MNQRLDKKSPHKKKTSSEMVSECDVIILAGGLGTRLRSVVSDRPKVLAEVAGRPFLDMLMENLRAQGVRRIILSVGHLKELIKERYADRDVFFAEEENPLGTGGGIKNAEQYVESENVLVMNGDSWLSDGLDLNKLVAFHKNKNALLTIVLAKPQAGEDYGVVFLNDEGKISRYREKGKGEKGHLMSAGIYAMRKDVFGRMPTTPFSIEDHFFPRMVDKGFYGFVVSGDVVDIGTPERYASAHGRFKKS